MTYDFGFDLTIKYGLKFPPFSQTESFSFRSDLVSTALFCNYPMVAVKMFSLYIYLYIISYYLYIYLCSSAPSTDDPPPNLRIAPHFPPLQSTALACFVSFYTIHSIHCILTHCIPAVVHSM